MESKKRIGLALSGGGYRAAAFHIGTFRKLKELGLLSKVDVISTISGGSIIGAYYALHADNFDAIDKELVNILNKKSVLKEILISPTFIFTVLYLLLVPILFLVFGVKYAILFFLLFIAQIITFFYFQYKIFAVGKVIIKSYNKFFYKNKTLADLPEKPIMAIGSTNIQTSRPFTFSKGRMGDSYYSYLATPILFKPDQFPIADAVAASSSVPFAFAPIVIGEEYFKDPTQAKDARPVLVDGGVYDNQGIQKLTQKGFYACDVVITSDAGNKLPFEGSYNNVAILLIRVMDVFMTRIKNFQMSQNIFSNTSSTTRQITYLSLGWDIENFISGFVDNLANGNIVPTVIDAHKIPAEWVKDVKRYKREITELLETNVNFKKIYSERATVAELVIARKVGTNLSALSMAQINALSKHAACMTELQVKLYCPAAFD